MQRITLSGTLLLLSVVVKAQTNTSVVSQMGIMQSATAVQSGSGNESTILQQTGTSTTPNIGNVASTSQTATATGGAVNQAFVRQINGSFYNTGSIKQTSGSGNTATIEQAYTSGGTTLYGNGATPSAVDAGNRASISQTGAGNMLVRIEQNGDVDGTSRANSAAIVQVGSNMSSSDDATEIIQSNNSIGNRASIGQGVAVGGATRNGAFIGQYDGSQQNQARIDQEGADKTGGIYQTNTSEQNQATISQVGVDGIATISQTSGSGYNEAVITQSSTASGFNQGLVRQSLSSYYNRAKVSQAGSGGNAFINQANESANNDAAIEQGRGGIGNVGRIDQTNAYDGASAGASTDLGAANSATITQNQTTNSTTGNVAVITQGSFEASPATNSVVVSTGNQASIGQENDLNVADLIQVGVSNKAGVVQNGYSTLKGAVAVGTLTADTAGQFGTNNVLTVQQTGSVSNPNIGNVTQIGTGNMSTIAQMVPAN